MSDEREHKLDLGATIKAGARRSHRHFNSEGATTIEMSAQCRERDHMITLEESGLSSRRVGKAKAREPIPVPRYP